MKKLKLTALNLGAKEVLTRTQLRNILGGSGSWPGGSGSGAGESCEAMFSSCCVECDGKGKTVDCGIGVTCLVSGTSIKCGNGEFVNQCTKP